jgi:hypothetical protein
MAQKVEYYPDGRSITVESETGDERAAREAKGRVNTSTAGLAAKMGKSAAPSNDGPEPQAGDFPSLGAFSEARRKYAANKAAKAASTPSPRPTP